MTIEIHRPELQAILLDRISNGADLEDVILSALQSSTGDQHLAPNGNPSRPAGRKSLVQLFADSPFKGLDIDFERDADTGSDISL